MNVLSDFFEKIYCINLDSRSDRWQNCLDIFQKYNLNSCQRISGVKISEEDFTYLDQKSKSQLGCALSFYRILKNAYDNDFKNLLIFEDDFCFIHSKEKTEEILKNSIKNLPNEWDTFYLGANIMYEYCTNPIEFFNEKLFKVNSAYCTHSIAFSKKGISIFINRFPEEGLFIESILKDYKTIDIFMAKEFCIENLCFISEELLCSQSFGFSSIENCLVDYSDLERRYKNSIENL